MFRIITVFFVKFQIYIKPFIPKFYDGNIQIVENLKSSMILYFDGTILGVKNSPLFHFF